MTPPEDDAPITRVCRKCSAQSARAGAYCDRCGTPYERRRQRPSRRQAIAAAVVLLLVAGAGAGLAVKRHDDSQARDRAAAAERNKKAQKAEDAENAQAAADDAERKSRQELVKALEKQITKDAKGHVKEGILDGPIKYSSCTATGGGSTDDLTALTGTFECIAVNKENKDGTVSGYTYQGTAEWASGDITWQLGR